MAVDPGLIEALRASLTPDLLKPEYRVDGAHPMAGHCYVASEALYHLAGKSAGFRPHRMRVGGVTHWWLEDPAGNRLDLTADQFPFTLDYSSGRCAGFLTRDPSKRSLRVIEKVSRACEKNSQDSGSDADKSYMNSKADRRERALEILRNHTGPEIMTMAEAVTIAGRCRLCGDQPADSVDFDGVCAWESCEREAAAQEAAR